MFFDLIYFQEEKDFEEKVKLALKSYHICKNDEKEISRKLIETMDKEIKVIFNKVLCMQFSLYNRI